MLKQEISVKLYILGNICKTIYLNIFLKNYNYVENGWEKILDNTNYCHYKFMRF